MINVGRLLACLILLGSVPSSNSNVLCSQQARGRTPQLSNAGGGSGGAVAATRAQQSLAGMGLTVELPSDAEPIGLDSMPELQRHVGDRTCMFEGSGWSLLVVRVTFDSKPTTKVLRQFGSDFAAGLGEDPDVTDFKWSLQPGGPDRIRISGGLKQDMVGLSLDGCFLSLGRDAVCAIVIHLGTNEGRATALRVLKSITPEG